MRIIWKAWGLGALIAAGLVLSNGTLLAADAPVVHVSAVVNDGTVRLQIEATGPFEYTTSRPDPDLYVVGLSGVAAGDPPATHTLASNLVMRYRLISYGAGNRAVVNVEILLKKGIEPRFERNGSQELILLVSPGAAVSAPSRPMPSPVTSAIVPIATKSAVASAPARSMSSPAPTAIVPAATKPAVASAPARPIPSPAASTSVRTASKPSGVSYPGAAGAIRQVRLTQNGESTEVSVIGSGPLTYHAMRLQAPDRLVLDFAGSHLETTENRIASSLDPVHEIRMGQFAPETSRVVIDLSQLALYSIKGEGNTVTVSFATKGNPGSHSR
jgi:hypothetical protein